MAPELILLDVGHGNCAVVIGDDTVAVIDVPRGGVHIDALKARSVTEIDAIIISHADADHMSGVAHLLYDEQIRVHKVYVNSDPSKTADGDGTVWRNFVIALADAVRRGEATDVAIQRGHDIELPDQRICLEVLSPSTELVLLGVGGAVDGRTITSNTLSAVVRVWFGDQPMALLPGDLDNLGLKKLLEEDGDLSAQLMVFPHHGGQSGGDDKEFAAAITEAVSPEIVFFSFGRNKYNNPRPEIIEGIRSVNPAVKIMCTQLSKRCSREAQFPPHTGPLPAKGRNTGNCCAGSVQFDQDGSHELAITSHAAFVDGLNPLPLCRRPLM